MPSASVVTARHPCMCASAQSDITRDCTIPAAEIGSVRRAEHMDAERPSTHILRGVRVDKGLVAFRRCAFHLGSCSGARTSLRSCNATTYCRVGPPVLAVRTGAEVVAVCLDGDVFSVLIHVGAPDPNSHRRADAGQASPVDPYAASVSVWIFDCLGIVACNALRRRASAPVAIHLACTAHTIRYERRVIATVRSLCATVCYRHAAHRRKQRAAARHAQLSAIHITPYIRKRR